jgi:hypothetical protein
MAETPQGPFGQLLEGGMSGMADVVVILLLIGVVALIVRGMRRGSIKTCDAASCGGACSGCSGSCSAPRIRLTKEQEHELRALREKREVV